MFACAVDAASVCLVNVGRLLEYIYTYIVHVVSFMEFPPPMPFGLGKSPMLQRVKTTLYLFVQSKERSSVQFSETVVLL